MKRKSKLIYSTFSSHVKPLISEEFDKYLSTASLDQIKEIIPDIDTESNIDLLPVAFNAFVVNRVNKNGDVIDTDTAVAIYKNFINKPINSEHNRKNIIGVILKTGFSEFGTDKPLTEEEVKGYKKPFNVTLGGVIWKVADKDLAESIQEASDPNSPEYGKISASWELGFSKFEIIKIKGSSKNIEDGEIVNDENSIKSLSSHLRSMGGSGKVDEYMLYRKPVEVVIPLGIGLTENPAAEVKGIATNKTQEVTEFENSEKPSEDQNEEEKEQEDENEENKIEEKSESSDKEELINILDNVSDNTEASIDSQLIPNKEEKISQNDNSDVIITNDNSNINKIMKITKIEDITDASLKEMSASVVADFLAEEIKVANDKYLQERDANEVAKKQFEDLASQHQTVQETLKTLESKLAEIEAQQAEQEKLAKFSSRMSEIDNGYDLSDEAKEVIAKQVSKLETDESYAEWLNSMSVFMKPFKKKDSSKEEKESKKDESEEAKASVETTVEEKTEVVEQALENGVVEKEVIANSTQTESPKNKWEKCLNESDIIVK